MDWQRPVFGMQSISSMKLWAWLKHNTILLVPPHTSLIQKTSCLNEKVLFSSFNSVAITKNKAWWHSAVITVMIGLCCIHVKKRTLDTLHVSANLSNLQYTANILNLIHIFFHRGLAQSPCINLNLWVCALCKVCKISGLFLSPSSNFTVALLIYQLISWNESLLSYKRGKLILLVIKKA